MQGYCSPPYKGGAGGESVGGESTAWSAAVMSSITVEKSDLEFATLIYDAVIFWQDYFFGQMLQNSWEDAKRDTKPRLKNSKNCDNYLKLPKSFGVNDLAEQGNLSKEAAKKQCQRWLACGCIKRKKYGVYEKIVNEIM